MIRSYYGPKNNRDGAKQGWPVFISSILEVSYLIQLARGIKVQTDHREQLIPGQ